MNIHAFNSCMNVFGENPVTFVNSIITNDAPGRVK